MSSKEEKSKKSKDKKLDQSKKSSEEQNIVIIYEYTEDRYKEMLKKKKDIDKHTLYLLLVIIVITILLTAFDGASIYNIASLGMIKYLYIGGYVTIILSIIILVFSLKDTFIKRRLFRYLFKKLYKVDIYKNLDLKDKIEKSYKTKEKEYKRKLTREEKRRISKRTIRENCCYRDMDNPTDILKTYKRKYTGKTEKLYEFLTKSMAARINEGILINEVKEISFKISLTLIVLSILLISLSKIYMFL